MFDKAISARNKIIEKLYKWILKPIFFMRDPELVHDRMIDFGHFLGKYWLTRKKTSLWFDYSNGVLEQKILGINFKNVGAKNGIYTWRR